MRWIFLLGKDACVDKDYRSVVSSILGSLSVHWELKSLMFCWLRSFLLCFVFVPLLLCVYLSLNYVFLECWFFLFILFKFSSKYHIAEELLVPQGTNFKMAVIIHSSYDSHRVIPFPSLSLNSPFHSLYSPLSSSLVPPPSNYVAEYHLLHHTSRVVLLYAFKPVDWLQRPSSCGLVHLHSWLPNAIFFNPFATEEKFEWANFPSSFFTISMLIKNYSLFSGFDFFFLALSAIGDDKRLPPPALYPGLPLTFLVFLCTTAHQIKRNLLFLIESKAEGTN